MLLPWNDKELIKKEYSKKHNSLFNVFEAIKACHVMSCPLGTSQVFVKKNSRKNIILFLMSLRQSMLVPLEGQRVCEKRIVVKT
jgi:hypothetical protein